MSESEVDVEEKTTQIETREEAEPFNPERAALPEEPVQQEPKTASPIKAFVTEYCARCEAAGICKNQVESQRLCLVIQKNVVLRKLVTEAKKLQIDLRNLAAVLKTAPAAATEKTQTSAAGVLVQRKTHPTQAHVEGGITWIKAFRASDGAEYEKATDKDNDRSEAYEKLRERINAKVDEGKKGLVEDGKWHWISEQGDFVGRKPAKQFARRT